MKYEMFPESFLALQSEILKDPKLMEHMAICCTERSSLEEKLAAICTYLNIAVDGMYDVDDMCDMLTKQLLSRNSLIIATHW